MSPETTRGTGASCGRAPLSRSCRGRRPEVAPSGVPESQPNASRRPVEVERGRAGLDLEPAAPRLGAACKTAAAIAWPAGSRRAPPRRRERPDVEVRRAARRGPRCAAVHASERDAALPDIEGRNSEAARRARAREAPLLARLKSRLVQVAAAAPRPVRQLREHVADRRVAARRLLAAARVGRDRRAAAASGPEVDVERDGARAHRDLRTSRPRSCVISDEAARGRVEAAPYHAGPPLRSATSAGSTVAIVSSARAGGGARKQASDRGHQHHRKAANLLRIATVDSNTAVGGSIRAMTSCAGVASAVRVLTASIAAEIERAARPRRVLLARPRGPADRRTSSARGAVRPPPSWRSRTREVRPAAEAGGLRGLRVRRLLRRQPGPSEDARADRGAHATSAAPS